MTRITVVDDIRELREDICAILSKAGYECEGASDGRSLARLLPRFAPDIVVLDVGLPGESGLEIASRLRAQQPGIGIIMLTGRTGLDDRLAGHRQGADHYLAKPVQPDELVLVVRTLERRLFPRAPEGWLLDTAQLRLTAPGGLSLPITPSEARVLEAIARSPRRQSGRRELAQALGENWDHYDERRLEALISRLRRKLTDGLGREAPLRALRGQGYGFVETLQMGSSTPRSTDRTTAQGYFIE